MITSTYHLPLQSSSEKVIHFLLSRVNKLDRDFFVLADFITCLPPEKPRDITFIPSVLKRVQRKMAGIVNKVYSTNRFHVAKHLFSNEAQQASKCGKHFSDTLACGSCVTSLFLPPFDVSCDLLLNRRTATWNLFVNHTL